MKRTWVFFCLLILSGTIIRAEDDIEDLLYAEEVQKRSTREGLAELLQEVAQALRERPEDYELLWQRAALNYFQGEFYSANVEEKKKYFTICKDLADRAVKLKPRGIAGHYWLGVGMAKWAEYNGILYSLFSADDILNEMNIVIGLNPHYFKGLPYSIRASVYAMAPGVISVGDWDKARADIKTALKQGASYRPNFLILADIYIYWSEWERAAALIEEGLKLPFDQRLTLEENDCINKLLERKKRVETELAKKSP